MGQKKEVDDRFKRFGTVGFTATSRVNDFISHLEDGRVTGTRCRTCERKYFPPRADCCHCLPGEMEWFDVDGPGTLLTYSRLQFGPIGFEGDLPYRIALADFGDFKVFGRLADGLPDQRVRIGMAVRPRVNPLPNGQINYVFESTEE